MSKAALPMRLARREVRRRPGRTALVALLVALPVAGMAIAVTMVRTGHTSLAEEWARYSGQADARLYHAGDAPGLELPAGSRQVVVATSYVQVSADDVAGGAAGEDPERVILELTDVPLFDPITAGINELLEGRAPTASGELALSPRVARRLGAEVGDVLEIERLALELEMVGLVEQPTCLSCNTGVVAPGQLPSLAVEQRGETRMLIDLPDMTDAEQLALLESAPPGVVELRELYVVGLMFSHGGSDEGVRWAYVVGALALTVVGIVITAAFAVGARRQLVTLGQLSASGASPATVRTALVLQGTFTGIVGTVTGLGIAALVLTLGHGRLETFLDERIAGYDVRPADLVGVVLIGVAAATIAALLPARTAARIPTLAALAGRRPLAPVPRRLVAAGFAAMAVGLGLLALAVLGSASGQSGDVWAFVAIAGGVLELLGACAIAPAVVARLEPLAGRFRGSWRLAARGLARHRSRTGAVVSAVAAAGALAVAATALVLGAEAQEPGHLVLPDDLVIAREALSEEIALPPEQGGGVAYLNSSRPPSAGVRTEIERILPDAQTSTVRTAHVSTAEGSTGPAAGAFWEVAFQGHQDQPGFASTYGMDLAIVADPAMLDAIDASAAVRRGLDEVGLVVLEVDADQPVVVSLPDGRTVEGVAADNDFTPGYLSSLLISSEAVDELGLEVRDAAIAYRAAEALTSEQRAELGDLRDDVNVTPRFPDATTAFVDVNWNTPDGGPSPFQLELLLTGIALIFSLFVVGVSLALAAAESKDERDVLTVVGAPPASLARSAGARAWLLSGIGGLMAVPVGFLPIVVFTRAETDDFPLVFPARTVLLLLIVVPTVVALVALATSATAQRLRPVRVSTATFE